MLWVNQSLCFVFVVILTSPMTALKLGKLHKYWEHKVHAKIEEICSVAYPHAQDHIQTKLFVMFASSILSLNMMGLPVLADDGWNDRTRLAAEAWRTVDEVYYDRTFNGNDWFQLRQEVIKQNYKSDDEVYTAIKTMLSKLGDKYTRYLPPAQYQSLVNSALGELTGVGVQLLGQDDGSVVIVNIEDDSPAKESGLLQGDVIVDVDGTNVKAAGLSPEEVAALLRGKQGTRASVRVARSGDLVKDFAITRQPFRITGVTSKKVSKGGRVIGIVTIKSFSSTTADDVSDALLDLKRSSPAVDKLIFDLRNNGGGLLQGAAQTASLLLPPEKIVVYVVSKGGQTESLRTTPLPDDSLSGLPDLTTPVDLLINRNSASAAEVFAAAIKENGRGRLIGERSFGKGIIQTVRELKKGGVAVTVSKYETPLHRDINKIGVDVDVKLACLEDAPTDICAEPTL